MTGHPEAERADPIAGDVRAVRRDGRERHGARKFKAALERKGVTASRRRIGNIMREQGVTGAYARGRSEPHRTRADEAKLANLPDPRVRQVRELRLVGPRPVRFGPSARVRARHALFAHDVADASPGRGDALPFQGGLELPGAVAFAAVAPDRAHVAGDRIRTLGFGMPGHPVAGGAGNARYPASRRYRAAGGVGPYHACLRANTGAACSETSTSISNCRSRLPGSTGSFRPGVRLSAARAEPLSRMPWTRRRGVDLYLVKSVFRD